MFCQISTTYQALNEPLNINALNDLLSQFPDNTVVSVFHHPQELRPQLVRSYVHAECKLEDGRSWHELRLYGVRDPVKTNGKIEIGTGDIDLISESWVNDFARKEGS